MEQMSNLQNIELMVPSNKSMQYFDNQIFDNSDNSKTLDLSKSQSWKRIIRGNKLMQQIQSNF